MGIQGLIQFLEKASSPVALEDIRGYTVAIDSYCWLHKGAFGCADQLSRGEDTNKYVLYCLKYVNLLLSYNIKPILVFDGRHLPAKALTEKRRRESREQSKKLAAELLRLGEVEQARSHMKRCIDITHEMAHRLIQECRKKNVDCIVAPYEADAQLAYLNKLNIAQYVITEDSDLVLFGCTKVIFKLDLNGQGLLVDSEKLYMAMGCRKDRYTFDKFRHMCILSGCDYLDSLRGIGLAKACKFFCRTEETDLRKALPKVPSYLNMKNLTVSEEYIENFLKADATFQYMFVYNPFTRKLDRLNELPPVRFDISLCSNAGEACDNETAFQLALGNLNPFTLKTLDNWNPDKQCQENGTTSSIGWNNRGKSKHKSIWQSNFKTHIPENHSTIEEGSRCAIEFKRYTLKDMNVRSYEVNENSNSENEILSLYTSNGEPPEKRQCTEDEITPPNALTSPPNNLTSPPSATKCRNPFLKINSDVTSPKNTEKIPHSLLKTLSPRKRLEEPLKTAPKLSSFNRTIVNPERKVLSRFFKRNESRIYKTETNPSDCCNNDQDSEMNPDNSSDDAASTLTQSQESEEQQRQQAAALYLSSPEATLSDRGDRTPPRRDSISEATGIGSLQAFDSGIDVSSNEKDLRDGQDVQLPKELLEKFEFKVRSKEIKILEEDENAIVISDEEEAKERIKITTIKPKPIVRRIGLSKPKGKNTKQTDATQSKLSKYFFQKKPTLQ